MMLIWATNPSIDCSQLNIVCFHLKHSPILKQTRFFTNKHRPPLLPFSDNVDATTTTTTTTITAPNIVVCSTQFIKHYWITPYLVLGTVFPYRTFLSSKNYNLSLKNMVLCFLSYIKRTCLEKTFNCTILQHTTTSHCFRQYIHVLSLPIQVHNLISFISIRIYQLFFTIKTKLCSLIKCMEYPFGMFLVHLEFRIVIIMSS